MNMKAAATLTGSLLARKGAAYPAAYSVPTPPPDDSSDSDASASSNRAYNDPRVIASAPPSPVVHPAENSPLAKPSKAEPSPVEPSPEEPSLAESSLTESSPVEPSPEEPSPEEPSLAEPSPVEPSPVEPSPVEPSPVNNGPQMQDGRFVKDIATPVQTPEPEPEADSAFDPEIEGVRQLAESPGLPHSMDKMGRVRLSVRLDPDRYLRVKMASARTRWSAQDIVIAALDKFLDGQPGNNTAENGNGATQQQGDEDSG